MTIWHIIAGALLLLPFGLYIGEIAHIGFRRWLRESMRQSAFEHLGSYLPKGLRIIGPVLYLALLFFCLYKMRPLGR